MAFLGYEGGWDSQIRQMMGKGKSGTGALTIESATVTASAPELKIERDRDGMPLDKEDVIVAEHLTQHKRIMTFRKVGDSRFMSEYPRTFTSNIRFSSEDVSETMTPAGMGPHTHDITMLAIADIQKDFDAVDVEVEYQDGLRKGDRVILACDDANMIYYVLDRAVIYR